MTTLNFARERGSEETEEERRPRTGEEAPPHPYPHPRRPWGRGCWSAVMVMLRLTEGRKHQPRFLSSSALDVAPGPPAV